MITFVQGRIDQQSLPKPGQLIIRPTMQAWIQTMGLKLGLGPDHLQKL